MTISPGHRFEATQALRQVLARAVVWGMIDSNPAKQGVDNPQRRRTAERPFESCAQLDELAVRIAAALPATWSSRPRPDCGPANGGRDAASEVAPGARSEDEAGQLWGQRRLTSLAHSLLRARS